MNYYQHHIGDFRSGTIHMSKLMRWLYRDMLEAYYDTERPLPVELEDLYDMVGAHEDAERSAVVRVLKLKFQLKEDGYHHERCNSELEKAAEAMEEANGRRENERERQRRTRERRKELFDQLRAYGDVPAWNITVEELQSRLNTYLSRVTGCDEGVTNSVRTAIVTANPITNTHLPTDHLPTDHLPTDHLPPNVKNLAPASADAAPKQKRTTKKAEPNPLNLETWKAYKHAYALRYGASPVQEAKSNAQIVTLVKRLGEEAPAVAAFYVSHSGARYMAAMHQLDLLVRDYAKLRTEWITKTVMTNTMAQQADKTATNLNAFGPLIAEAKAKEAEEERNRNAQQ